MKCKVCGAESGKYPLCRICNDKKEAGEIIKCSTCNRWHYKDHPCTQENESNTDSMSNNNINISTNTTNSVNDSTHTDNYLYNLKNTLISKNESLYFNAIKGVVPKGYFVFPQVNLASFISRTDGSRFQNELFRNVDFLVTDNNYSPKIVIEINDKSHLTAERKSRDEKVQKICEEAGIPIIKLWTSYGVNPEYIKNKITETLLLPAKRVCHSKNDDKPQSPKKSKGCYIATAVYGSYDCPNVWVLRRFRDIKLLNSWYGKYLVNFYYAVSPILVKIFGKSIIFNAISKTILDSFVDKLQKQGFENTPYID